MKMVKKILSVLANTFFLLPLYANAHLLSAQNATINLKGNSAYIVVSVPVSTLTNIHTTSRGLLTADELSAQSQDIAAQVKKRFELIDGERSAKVLFIWVLPAQTDPGPIKDMNYVVALERVDFNAPPAHLSVWTDLFGSRPGEQSLRLLVTSDKQSELVILDANQPRRGLFRGRWASFVDFIRVGVDHILTGVDHLLFLLTIVVAGSDPWYWFSVITSFTIAHSITLALTVFNIVHVPSAIVEPAIAASIVLMAVWNLLRRSVEKRHRVMVIAACGLLHGMGFASALSEMGLDQQHLVSSLIGFNLGIETGQVIFVCAILVGQFFLQRIFCGTAMKARWIATASIVAAVGGALMLAERLYSLAV